MGPTRCCALYQRLRWWGLFNLMARGLSEARSAKTQSPTRDGRYAEEPTDRSDAGRNSFTGSSRLAGQSGWLLEDRDCGDLTNSPRRMSQTFPVSIRTASAADHAAALGVTASPTKPSLGMSRIFGTTERSSGYSSAASILEQRSSLRSFIGWQTSCGDFAVPVRSKRACSRSRANFCSRSDRARPVNNRELSKPPPDSMVMAKCRARTDHTSRRPATENRYQRPCIHRSNQA